MNDEQVCLTEDDDENEIFHINIKSSKGEAKTNEGVCHLSSSIKLLIMVRGFTFEPDEIESIVSFEKDRFRLVMACEKIRSNGSNDIGPFFSDNHRQFAINTMNRWNTIRAIMKKKSIVDTQLIQTALENVYTESIVSTLIHIHSFPERESHVFPILIKRDNTAETISEYEHETACSLISNRRSYSWISPFLVYMCSVSMKLDEIETWISKIIQNGKEEENNFRMFLSSRQSPKEEVDYIVNEISIIAKEARHKNKSSRSIHPLVPITGQKWREVPFPVGWSRLFKKVLDRYETQHHMDNIYLVGDHIRMDITRKKEIKYKKAGYRESPIIMDDEYHFESNKVVTIASVDWKDPQIAADIYSFSILDNYHVIQITNPIVIVSWTATEQGGMATIHKCTWTNTPHPHMSPVSHIPILSLTKEFDHPMYIQMDKFFSICTQVINIRINKPYTDMTGIPILSVLVQWRHHNVYMNESMLVTKYRFSWNDSGNMFLVAKDIANVSLATREGKCKWESTNIQDPLVPHTMFAQAALRVMNSIPDEIKISRRRWEDFLIWASGKYGPAARLETFIRRQYDKQNQTLASSDLVVAIERIQIYVIPDALRVEEGNLNMNTLRDLYIHYSK